jgi:hypothetical protein
MISSERKKEYSSLHAPSLAPSSSMPSIIFLCTSPPSFIFLPIDKMTSKAAVLAFSDGSFVPKTASGINEGMTCIDFDGIRGISKDSKLNRSCANISDRIPSYTYKPITFLAAGARPSANSSSCRRIASASTVTLPLSTSLAKILYPRFCTPLSFPPMTSFDKDKLNNVVASEDER